MLLTLLEQYDLEDAILESRARILRNALICDGYGRTYDMKYNNWHKDPKPLVLVIGYWNHPSTGNRLLCGVNLNTLQPDQIVELRKALPRILKAGKDAKSRYWAGRKLAPTIFKGAYRTYNTDHVDAVSPGTLRFWNPKADFRRERDRMLELEKERLLKKKKRKENKLKQAERLKPKPVKVKQPPRDIPYEEPEKVNQELINPESEDLFDEIDGVKPAKPAKPDPVDRRRLLAKKAKLVKQKAIKKKQKQDRLEKAVHKALQKEKPKRSKVVRKQKQQPRSIPYESYVNSHDIFIRDSDDVVVYHMPTRKLIADGCDAVNIITNAGWDSDECVVFERSKNWSADHCYNGYGPIERLAENVQYKIMAIMG